MGDALRVLYVDDEDDIRTIVETSLGLDPDLEVKAVDSGDGALEIFDTGDWMPDIALVDVMMPGMNGIELLGHMRARHDTAKIPIVFVTASARSMEVQRYTDAGAVGVISKPFDPLGLAGLVRSHVALTRLRGQ